jgi:hypothetical protein
MKTNGEFSIVVRGSTERTGKVPLTSWDGFHYLMQRLLTGQEVADEEFRHYGVEIELDPPASC